MTEHRALKKCRILDMTDESGVFATKILAALGADVIRIEPPGGHPTRRIGPYYHDEVDPEKSLHWFTYNLNKRSVTLNLENESGRDLFRQLVSTAGFLFECFPPGYLDDLGIGFSDLSSVNPRLIHTSITPRGSTGPRSQFKGSNLCVSASSGFLYLCGDSDRPPAQIATPLAYIQSGLQAAAAAMVADYYCQVTGKGQHIDVSAQECLMAQTLPITFHWKAKGEMARRSAVGAVIPSRAATPEMIKCADGYVIAATTPSAGRQSLREWLRSAGMAGDLFEKRWDSFFLEGTAATKAQKMHIDDLFRAFAGTRKGEDLMREAQAKGVQVTRVHDVRDVIQNPQSKHRGYFVKVEHPELGDSITYPGSPFISKEIEWKYRRRAPFVGEHNQEVYGRELGLSRRRIAALKKEGAI